MRAPIKLKDVPGEEYQRLLQRSLVQLEKVLPCVVPIISQVRERGDDALLSLTEQFDSVKISPDSLIITKDRIKEAYKKLPSSLLDSLQKMHQQVEDFHRHQILREWSLNKDMPGAYWLGQRFVPVEKAAVYVPGGKASYPSTVIMGCVPAKLAGVSQIIVCSPPSFGGEVRPEIMVASDIAGVDLIVNAGGAQVIAALAFGTERCPRVDVIVGPGNIYVTCAKVYLASLGLVGIDCPAGPSEVLIIADDSAPSSYIVWDMLVQAEHDEASWCGLVTPSQRLARMVYENIEREIEGTERRSIIRSSLEHNGFILVVDNLDEAIHFANQFAPEHLEIMTKDPDDLFPLIKSAGSVFLGPFSPVAAGDYFTGTNHILPTGGLARFSSGLSVATFLKRITYQKLTSKALDSVREPISHLARREGFQAHLRSIQVRDSGGEL